MEKPGASFFIAMSFVSAFAGAIGGFVLSNNFLGGRVIDLEEQMASTPRFAIADFARVAMTFPQGMAESEVDEIIAAYNENIKKLQDAGFLIINGNSIARAPEDYYIPDPRTLKPSESSEE